MVTAPAPAPEIVRDPKLSAEAEPERFLLLYLDAELFDEWRLPEWLVLFVPEGRAWCHPRTRLTGIRAGIDSFCRTTGSYSSSGSTS